MNAIEAANQVDAHIGDRIATRRTALGLTREAVAQALGLTPHQIEAFEGGVARVGSATLFELADLLHVTVAYFFETKTLGSAPTGVAQDAREFDPAG